MYSAWQRGWRSGWLLLALLVLSQCTAPVSEQGSSSATSKQATSSVVQSEAAPFHVGAWHFSSDFPWRLQARIEASGPLTAEHRYALRDRAARRMGARLLKQAGEDVRLAYGPFPALVETLLKRWRWQPQPLRVPLHQGHWHTVAPGRWQVTWDMDDIALSEQLAARVARLDRQLQRYRFFSDTEPAMVQLNRLLPAWLLLMERAHATVILDRLIPGRAETKRDRLARELLNHVNHLFRQVEQNDALPVNGKAHQAG